MKYINNQKTINDILNILIFIFSVFLFANNAFASSDSWKENIPDELRPWINWVSKDLVKNPCPSTHNDFSNKLCDFMTHLRINVENNKIFFTEKLYIYEDTFVKLLGGKNLFPYDVKDDDKNIQVIYKNNAPYVFLKKGSHEISGTIRIENGEDEILLPENVATLKFLKNDKEEKNVSIIKNKLQLGLAKNIVKENKEQIKNITDDNIDIQVRRILNDDLPFTVTTLLKLNISGKEREINLGKVVFPDTRVININSSLQVKLDDSKNFIFKASSGTYEVQIESIYDAIPDKIPFFKSTNDFPDEEIWGYILNDTLRTTQINGAVNISPINFGYPIKNSSMRVYEIKNNQNFEIVEKERAPIIDATNSLTLQRTLWLNFKGDGYFALDNLNGQIKKNDIMEISDDFNLAKANINGSDVPIISQNNSSKIGLNLHEGHVNLQSEGRYKNIKEFSLSPFSFVKGNVSLSLQLPAGWKVFNISNIKNDSYSWISKWNLLKLFYLCLTFFIVLKVYSLKSGIVALFAIIFTHDTPISLYMPLILICFFHFISKLLVDIENKKFYFNLSNRLQTIILILLIIFSVPFVVSDIRSAIYPQLKFNIFSSPDNIYKNNSYRYQRKAAGAMMAYMAASSDEDREVALEDGAVDRSVATNGLMGDSSIPARPLGKKVINTHLNVPTGYGKPMWAGTTVIRLNEDNIPQGKKIKICYLTPFMNTIISFIRAFLLVWLIILLVNESFYNKIKDYIVSKFPKLVSCFILIFVSSLFLNICKANAEPSKEVLDDLKNYVNENINKVPSCMPDCASFTEGKLTINNEKSSFELKVNALTDLAFPVIKSNNDYIINEILIDNENVSKAVRTPNGNIFIFLNKGTHDVKIIFTLQNVSMPNFVFDMPIAKLKLNLQGYEYFGNKDFVTSIKLRKIEAQEGDINNDKLNNSNISANDQKSNIKTKLVLSSYYFITREVFLTDNVFKLVTSVQRFGNTDEASNIWITLNKDESILTQNITVKDNKMFIDFAKGESFKKVESILYSKNIITLQSQNLEFVYEKWKIYQSEHWFLNFNGIPEILRNGERYWLPRHDEKLEVLVSPIKNADAPLETITKSTLDYTLGKDFLSASLTFNIRSSHGGKHEFKLPKEFELESCFINNNKVPCVSNVDETRNISLELMPSEQEVLLKLKAPSNWKFRYKLPKIDVSLASVNSITKVTMQNNEARRLLLWTRGPKMGPCVLFWITLPIIFLLSVFFKYGLKSEIKFIEWFILLLGFSLLQTYVESFLILLWIVVGIFVMRKTESIINNPEMCNPQNVNETSTPKKVKSPHYKIYLVFGVIAVIAFCSLIKVALLGQTPNMWVAGNGSYMNNYQSILVWYEDIVSNILPVPEIISVNIIYYKIFIVFWALWSSVFIIKYISKIIKKLVNI